MLRPSPTRRADVAVLCRWPAHLDPRYRLFCVLGTSTATSRSGRDHPLNLSISISGGKETYKDSPSNGERTGNSPALKSGSGNLIVARIVVWRSVLTTDAGPSPLEGGAGEGESPVVARTPVAPRGAVAESGCLGMQPQSGGKFRPRLNTGERPIANKYREGKMKRTLKRESKVLEIVGREAIGAGLMPPLGRDCGS